MIYFVGAVALTIWAARRIPTAWGVAFVGLLMVLAAPAMIGVLGWVEGVAYQRRVAGTRVTEVQDEPIISGTGKPIGVRLSYTVSVPKRGYFGISPTLYGVGRRNERLRLDSRGLTVDGSREPVAFQPGKSHRVVAELYPPLLLFARDTRCLSSSGVPPLPDGPEARPLRVVIYETNYGNAASGGERFTRESYDLAELYRSVLAEGLSPCQ
jgi:hypothetical protein